MREFTPSRPFTPSNPSKDKEFNTDCPTPTTAEFYMLYNAPGEREGTLMSVPTPEAVLNMVRHALESGATKIDIRRRAI